MRYEEKIITHPEQETGSGELKEASANVEFSHGDLIELKNILREFQPNLWAKELLTNIESTLEQVDEF